MAEITEKQDVALETISKKVTENETFLSKVVDSVKSIIQPKQEVKLESYTLENGVVVEEENGDVFILGENGERVPAPVGEHVLEDGRVLVVVEEGKLSEIKEAVSEEAPVEAEEEKVEFASYEDFQALKKEVEELKAMLQPKEEDVEMAEEVKKEANLEVEKVEAKKVEHLEETEDIKHSPEKEVNKRNVELYAQNRRGTIKDNIYKQLFG